MNGSGYSSPMGVEAAIKAAAQQVSARDPSGTVSDRIMQEYFRRFLTRIFSQGENSAWVLKGGSGILARVGAARTTTDLDLAREEASLEGALTDLRRLALLDLGDFFMFEYTGHQQVIGGQQMHTEGFQVSFDVYIGANRRGVLNVDLVVNVVMTDTPTLAPPAHGLDLPRLPTVDYRLYPVVDQIADKICATLTTYNERASTREWDLVDLVVLATTEGINADKLFLALTQEAKVRDLQLPKMFSIPQHWGIRYAKEAQHVPACANYATVDQASRLMHAFIDPVLRNEVSGKTWNHVHLHWMDR